VPFVVEPAFIVRVAGWQSKAHLFVRGLAKSQNSLVVSVINYPKVDLGSPATFEITLEDKKVTLLTYVSERMALNELADLDDPFGIDVQTNFIFKPPLFPTGAVNVEFPEYMEGSADVRIATEEHPDINIGFSLEYFAFPLSEVTLISPTAGARFGGTRVMIELTEPQTQQTRFAVGEPTFAGATALSTKVYFDDLPGENVVVTETPSGRIAIEVTTPVVGELMMGSLLLTFTVNQVLQPAIMQKTKDQPVFYYRQAQIRQIKPSSALTLGGYPITITISGLLNDVISAKVELSSLECSSVLVAMVDSSDPDAGEFKTVEITANTPKVDGDGHQNVQITLTQDDAEFMIDGSGLFNFVLPPNPTFSDIIVFVGGDHYQYWEVAVDTKKSSSVGMTILYLGPSDVELVVELEGPSPSKARTPCALVQAPIVTIEGDNVRTSKTEIEFNTPINVEPGKYSILVNTESNRFGKRTVSGPSIRFENMDEPTIVEISPSESRMSGGAVVVLGIRSVCFGFPVCPPPEGLNLDGTPKVRLTFGVTTAIIEGSLTLRSWTSKDGKYLALKKQLPRYFSEITPFEESGIASVVAMLSNGMTGKVSNLNSYLVFARSPTLGGAARTMPVSYSAYDHTDIVYFSGIKYESDPTGPAVVDMRVTSPTVGVASEGTIVRVKLTNFRIVYAKADLLITLGGENLFDADVFREGNCRIESSTSTSTVLVLTLPLDLSIGTKAIEISPFGLAVNKGTFAFIVRSDSPPIVQSVKPLNVYADGLDTVTVAIDHFGGNQVQPSDVQILMEVGGTKTKITKFELTPPTTDSTSTIIVVTIPKIQMQANSEVAALVFEVAKRGEMAKTLIALYAEPTGDLIFNTLNPVAVSAEGGTLVTMTLRNVRRLDTISNLGLTYGVTGPEATPVPVQLGTSSCVCTCTIGDSETCPGAYLCAASDTCAISSFDSRIDFTTVSFITPRATAVGLLSEGTIDIGIEQGTRAGIFENFRIFNPNQAELTKDSPKPTLGASSTVTKVSIGVKNFGCIITSEDQIVVDAKTVSAIDRVEKVVDIQLVNVLRSDEVVTQFDIGIPEDPYNYVRPPLDLELQVTIYPKCYTTYEADDVPSRRVSFTFVWQSDQMLGIVGISPKKSFTDGGQRFTVDVQALPETLCGLPPNEEACRPLVAADVKIAFPNFMNTDDEFLTAPVELIVRGEGTQSEVHGTFPRYPSPPAYPFVLSPTLVVNEIEKVKFPSRVTLKYEVPPPPTIQSVTPNKGFAEVPGEVKIVVKSFPAVQSTADVSVKFRDDDNHEYMADVIAVVRVDKNLDAFQVQDIEVYVKTPCNSCGGAEIIQVGRFQINVVHTDFPTRMAETTGSGGFIFQA